LIYINGAADVFRIGTVRYNWPMSAHASQAFSIAHCTDSKDLLINDIDESAGGKILKFARQWKPSEML